MKKRLLILLILMLTPLMVEATCGPSAGATNKPDVKIGKTVNDAEKAVGQKRAVLVCEYASENSKDGVRFYYNFNTTNTFSTTDKYDAWEYNWSGKWIFHYKTSGDSWKMLHSGGNYYGCGAFSDILMNGGKADDGRVSYNFDEGSFNEGEDNFVCPSYAFIDTDAYNELCIGNNDSCGPKFDRLRLDLVKDNDSIFNHIDKFVGSTLWNDNNIVSNIFSTENLKQHSMAYLVQTSVTDYIDLRYFDNGHFEAPQFIYNYINDNYAVDKLINYESYEKFQQTKFNEIDAAVAAGTLTEEEASQIKAKITGFYDITSEENKKNHEDQKKDEAGGNLPGGFTTEELDDFTKTCKNFAPALRILGVLLYIAKILLPIILIIKASLDLASTVTSGDAGTFNKKVQKIVYSLVAGVAIFFIPTIVNIAFGFISDYSTGITDDAKVCSACLLDPFNLDCTQYADRK